MKKIIKTIFVSLFLFQIGISQTTVQFILTDIPNLKGNKVGIRGNIYPLDWNKSIQLKENESGYSAVVKFPEHVSEIEFKFVLFEDDSNPKWEETGNRSEILGGKTKVISRHEWNVEQVIDIGNLPLIQPEELLNDFRLIEQMILDVHPGTYRYNDEESIKKNLKELKDTFQEPLSYGEAYLAMAKLTAAIKCDHTKPGFNNQNKIINSVIHGQPDKLPFTFRWFENRMFVMYDASSESELERGDEVLSINGVNVSEIQGSMVPYIAADGDTDNNRIRKMEVDGYDFRYNAFDVFFPLLYPFDDKVLELEIVKKAGHSSKKITVTALTRDERAKILTSRFLEFPENRDELWNFRITEDNVGILEANSFGLMGWKALSIDYKAFLQDVFEELSEKNIQDLIIDIRENTGGNDEMSVELFSYLDIKESIVKEIYREGRTRYLNFPEPLKNNTDTWGDNPWYFNFDERDKEGIYYTFKQNPENKVYLKQKENIYKGNVYLLTSSQNTSLAYYTALNFKRQGLGTSIGQETGGNMRGINGGQILFLRLPSSGIEIDFSIMGGFVYGNQPNEGVKPDIEVTPTLQQLVDGEDVEMNVALEIIRSK
ncbi:MAG: S41 family peptidase [Balneolaceae bacterium]